MSESAPWNYQGQPAQGQGNNNIKMFNPADFQSTSNSSAWGDSVGNSSWNWNPDMWNSSDSNAKDHNAVQESHSQNQDQNAMAPQGGGDPNQQQYDPNQQNFYGNQYWDGQNGWDQNQYYQNSGYEQQQQVLSQQQQQQVLSQQQQQQQQSWNPAVSESAQYQNQMNYYSSNQNQPNSDGYSNDAPSYGGQNLGQEGADSSENYVIESQNYAMQGHENMVPSSQYSPQDSWNYSQQDVQSQEAGASGFDGAVNDWDSFPVQESCKSVDNISLMAVQGSNVTLDAQNIDEKSGGSDNQQIAEAEQSQNHNASLASTSDKNVDHGDESLEDRNQTHLQHLDTETLQAFDQQNQNDDRFAYHKRNVHHGEVSCVSLMAVQGSSADLVDVDNLEDEQEQKTDKTDGLNELTPAEGSSVFDTSRLAPVYEKVHVPDHASQELEATDAGNINVDTPASGSTGVATGSPSGLSDWEVVPHQNPEGSSQHSRQGSLDENVHFFIGSTRSSPKSENISPAPVSSPPRPKQHVDSSKGMAGPQEDHANDGGTKISDNTAPVSSVASQLVPQFTSSPADAVVSKPPQHPPPPPAGSEAGAGTPPSGFQRGPDNPFRKSGGSRRAGGETGSSGTSVPSSGNGTARVQAKHKSERPHLNVGVPSPIFGDDENINKPAQRKQESPIMPRKESPFQPPSRTRTKSGSSDVIEEVPSENNSQKSSGDKDRKPHSDSFGSSRSSGSDASRKSNMGREKDKRSRPPPGPRSRPLMSPRRMQEAYQTRQAQRAKHNISPATSLWADDDKFLQTNILLAPAAPLPMVSPLTIQPVKKDDKSTNRNTTSGVLTPVENLITSMSEHLSSKENTPEPSSKKQEPVAKVPLSRDKPTKENQDRRHERNSSIDRELETVRRQEEEEERERKRGHYSQRDQYKDERTRGRDSRDSRDPRNPDYDPYYDRQGGYGKRGYAGGRDAYRDPYNPDDRPRSRNSTLDDSVSSRKGPEDRRPQSRQDYDRPRSREGIIDRPRSRQENPDRDRPRSRQDYGHDPYYKDNRYKGYYDDYYGRGYYDPYYDRDGYYRDGRYDGYYDNYGRAQGPYDERYYGYQGHYGYPADYYGREYDEYDRYSQRMVSRGQTPSNLSDGVDQDPYSYDPSRASSRGAYEDYRGRYDPYYGYYGRGGYDYSYEEQKPGRMTPPKYSIPHMCARFGPGGQLVKVMPNRPADGQPATVEIHEVNEVLQDDPDTEELKEFPGPLIRGDTHKNDVLMFCQRKAKACADNVSLMDRESVELIWKLLELLIKQNGTVMGTDIADLLLEGHEPTTAEYSMLGMKISSSLDNLHEEFDDTTDIITSTFAADRSMINRAKSREEITDRFRHLLLYGRKKDALDWAMKKSLWGHALFLASKMDTRTHANVMTRFANSAMKINDPLQTLYQLMSHRQPAAVTSIADDKWGDWRPHLAMILSNQSKEDLVRKSICCLGDTLASKGFLHASHFCYLMGQCSFGTFQKKTSKIVLIGSNHNLPLAAFCTNEAIQCTEIYEYAMSLGNSLFVLANFQYFRFLYACRLAECGFPSEALHYCEVISLHIQKAPTFFSPTLVKLVYNLAEQLKYFDPQRLHTGEETEDPYWLQQLQRIHQGFEDGSLQPLSGSVTPSAIFGSLRAGSTESGEVAGYNYGSSVDPGSQGQAGSATGHDPNYHGYATGNMDPNQTWAQGQVDTSQGWNQGQADASANWGQGQVQGQQGYDSAGYNYQQYDHQQQQGQITGEEHANQEAVSHSAGSEYQPEATNDSVPQSQSEQTNQYEGYNSYNQYYNPTQHGAPSHQGSHQENQNTFLQSSMGSTATTSAGTTITEEDEDEEEEEEGEVEDRVDSHDPEASASSFDYFSQQHRPIIAPRLRPRTISETSTDDKGSSGSHRNIHHGNVSGGNNDISAKPPVKKEDTKDQKKSKGGGGGLFGGFFNKLMPKAKNEIILPSDKEPSIVWDEAKGKWVNKDGEDEDEKPAAPPPKDSDLGATPAATGPPAPGMGANKFAKPKGPRAQYVDVMNQGRNSMAEVPKGLFNVMPTSASAPAIFNPGMLTEDAPQSDQSKQETSAEPPPSSSSGEGTNVNTSEQPAPGPMLFNPAEFKKPVGPAPVAAGNKHSRLQQRRVYPK